MSISYLNHFVQQKKNNKIKALLYVSFDKQTYSSCFTRTNMSHYSYTKPVNSRFTAWLLEVFLGYSGKVWSKACPLLSTETSKFRRHSTTLTTTTTTLMTFQTTKPFRQRKNFRPIFTLYTTARSKMPCPTRMLTTFELQARSTLASQQAPSESRFERIPALTNTRRTRAMTRRSRIGIGLDILRKIDERNPAASNRFKFFEKMKLFS